MIGGKHGFGSDLGRTAATIGIMAAVVLSACAPRKANPPIAADVMTDLLVSLHLAHAQAALTGTDSTARADSVLERYGVSAGQFEAAVRHYAERPEAFVALMDTVIDRMRVMRPAADVEEKVPLYARRYGSAFGDTSGAATP